MLGHLAETLWHRKRFRMIRRGDCSRSTAVDCWACSRPKPKQFKESAGLPLRQLVRASSAAATYCPPQPIAAPDGAGKTPSHEFVDGGVRSYLSSALQVFLGATSPECGHGWPMGGERLL